MPSGTGLAATAAVPPTDAIPYCGPPPLPGELASAWNLDPVVLAALALLAVAYTAGAGRAGAGVPRHARLAFAGGMAVLVVAFVSPLCRAGVALFSARVGQHLLLALAAAPLLMLGRPREAFAALSGGGRAPAADRPGSAAAAGGAFAVALWLWHAPAPYDATLRSDGLYWLMHLSLLGTACWLWAGLLRRDPAGSAMSALLGLATALQMGLLGALLVFAPRPLYTSHLATTQPWGLSPLADQALAGLLCWVPGCAAFAAAGLVALWPWLRPPLATAATAATVPAVAALATDSRTSGAPRR